MAVGDRYIYIGILAVSIQSQRASIGDKVICMKYNGGIIKPKTYVVGDTVVLVPTPCGKVVVGGLAYDDFVFVTSAWSRPVAYRYEEVSLGTFEFNWSGNGNVYLSSVSDSLEDMMADDAVRITTESGTLFFDAGTPNVYYGTPEITSICQHGLNNVEISIKDHWIGNIGSSDIYIVNA